MAQTQRDIEYSSPIICINEIRYNQTIANILETAVNTVYSYKTRIRSKAIVSAEDFERMVMEIKFSEIE